MAEQLKAWEQCECPTRKALEAMPCRCMKLVSANNCPQCGGLLHPVQYPSNSMLNRDQFDATRAGDFYCESCKGAEARSGFKYFWESDFPVRIEKCTRCEALQPPCPCEALRQRLELIEGSFQSVAPAGTSQSDVMRGRASITDAYIREGQPPQKVNWMYGQAVIQFLRAEKAEAERDRLRAELTASQERERVLREALEDCKRQMEAFAGQMAGYPSYGRAIDVAETVLATPEGTVKS